jgi:hypothetical protein
MQSEPRIDSSYQSEESESEHFSSHFFNVIRVLDNKKEDPLKDFIAHKLIEQGMFLDHKTFAKALSKETLEDQLKLLDLFYCVNQGNEKFFVLNPMIEKRYNEEK